jgi:uncharacterized glyoxalase superfamily protein PhnB/predicted enzyme related to lactoylglutathione lyase
MRIAYGTRVMQAPSFRYIVDDVGAAIDFYALLGFELEAHPAPGFASLRHGSVQLLLNAPGAGGAGRVLPDGTSPEPGGWNRIQLTVTDLDGRCRELQQRGATFRAEVIEGRGGRQRLVEDPAGNVVELFEPYGGKPARIPSGFHTVTPFLVVDDVSELVNFIQQGLGGRCSHVMKSDDGVWRHATVRIGDSPLMISSGTQLYEVRPATLHLYVDDVDSLYAQAIQAGAEKIESPTDQFYGDRRAGVRDRWNNHWWIASRVEEIDEADLKAREAAFRQEGSK